MIIWIKKNATETGKPFGVVWHTLRKGEVRYFDPKPVPLP
jgi:hypothetical protein